MTTFIDAFGCTITQSEDGAWIRKGCTVGPCDAATALSAFNGMAPDGWSSPVPPAPTTIASYEFILRFTPAEQSALMAANPLWGVLVAAAGTIDVTVPTFVAYLQAAVASGALTQARMTQVLNLAVASP